MIKEKNKIGIIETIRGIAALAVCLFHFSKANIDFKGSSELFKTISSYGWTGVEAFFVVSGFIIPFSLYRSNYKLKHFPRFFLKRSIRLEPVYIICILLVIIINYLSWLAPGFKGVKPDINISNIIFHIFYLPEYFGLQWILPVFWTLQIEIQFYLLMGIFYALFWNKVNNFILSNLMLLILSFFIPLKVFVYIPYFIMGMLVCARKIDYIQSYTLYTGIIICSSVLLIHHENIVPIFVGVLTALLIFFIEFKNVITDFLGKISYSLYLIHIPIGSRILNLSGRYVHEPYEVWLAIVFALFCTILSAWLFYRFIEKPFQLMSKKIAYL